MDKERIERALKDFYLYSRPLSIVYTDPVNVGDIYRVVERTQLLVAEIVKALEED